jgi:anaerobic dimethyl sulfoxide reductase subunit B (iron-sulfur subunit)
MTEQWGMYMDLTRCIGCHACSIACADFHGLRATDSWRAVISIETGEFPNPFVIHIPSTCYHCTLPACLAVCPSQAIRKELELGRVVLDSHLCTGCGACMEACPFAAIRWQEVNHCASKCDLCGERLKLGRQPICVAACPLRALDAGPIRLLQEKYPGGTAVPSFPDDRNCRPNVWVKDKMPKI